MIQWHPIFAQLLRRVVEEYYDLQTNVPVGDVPREADFVLLRRTARTTPPFKGLWRHLTPWSILEFKGPTVSARRRDVELLIELGLGIDRRLYQTCGEQGQWCPGPQEVSFWYLANNLGGRFLREAEQKLGGFEQMGDGIWKSGVLGRLVFLVSSTGLPVELDSLPLHVVGREPAALERQVARLVVEQPGLQQLYGGWLASLHPKAWQEVESMARSVGKSLKIDLQPMIETLGPGFVIEQIGAERVIEQIGAEKAIELLGAKKIIKLIGIRQMLANLSSAEKRELKELLR